MGLVNTHPRLIYKVLLMNTFFDVLAFHRWETPVVFPVSSGLSLEDHRVSNALFFISSYILVLRQSIFLIKENSNQSFVKLLRPKKRCKTIQSIRRLVKIKLLMFKSQQGEQHSFGHLFRRKEICKECVRSPILKI